MICTTCHKEIPNESEFCPFCGLKLVNRKNKKKGMLVGVKLSIFAAVFFFCISVFMGYKWYSAEKQNREKEISMQEKDIKIDNMSVDIEKMSKNIENLLEENNLLTQEIDECRANSNELYKGHAYYTSLIDSLSSTVYKSTIGSFYSNIIAIRKGTTEKVSFKSNNSDIWLYGDGIVKASWDDVREGDNYLINISSSQIGLGKIYVCDNKEGKNPVTLLIVTY